jgi:hypothetical protein
MMSDRVNSEAINKWKQLWVELNDSFSHIAGSPTGVFYLLVSLVLGGAAGLWIPLMALKSEIGTDALSTYIFAVLAPVLADFLLDSGADKEPGKKEIRLFVLFICVLAACFALIALFRNSDRIGWVFGWFGALLSLIAWIFVYTKSSRFTNDDDNFDGSFGGAEVKPEEISGAGLPA